MQIVCRCRQRHSNESWLSCVCSNVVIETRSVEGNASVCLHVGMNVVTKSKDICWEHIHQNNV